MKTFTLFAVFTLTFLLTEAQNCSKTGNFEGAVDVDVTGSVTLEVQENGNIQLKLSSDFKSDAGPDLDLYLGNSNEVNSSSLKLEALASLTGEQVYTLPANISLDDYSYVTVHCTQYNHYYGAAFLETKQGDCSTLKVNDLKSILDISLKIDATGILIDSANNYSDASIAIFDFSGKIVAKKTAVELNQGQQKIHMNAPLMGIARLTTNQGVISQKFIQN